MNAPELFYHVAVLNHWKEVVDEQLDALQTTGLQRCPMWVGLAGADEESLAWLVRRLRPFNVVEMSVHRHLDAYERPTMRMLERRAKEVKEETPILYFHTKGLKDGKNTHKERWRYLMMREVVLKYRQCLGHLLDGADAVGVDWRAMVGRGGTISHFSGNFWWARSSYVAQLESLDAYYEKPRYPANWSEGKRLGCEFWISSGPREPRVVSLVCENVDLVKPSEVERVLALG